MINKKVKIEWPDGSTSFSNSGENWLVAAQNANVNIPTGCLGGSCGACEIEVNGEVYRACISQIPNISKLKVDILEDPYW